jgi:hypothetical protein
LSEFFGILIVSKIPNRTRIDRNSTVFEYVKIILLGHQILWQSSENGWMWPSGGLEHRHRQTSHTQPDHQTCNISLMQPLFFFSFLSMH